MKKYLILIIFIVSSLGIFAQGLKFSVFADPKLSWMSPDLQDVSSEGSKLGVNIGLNVDNYFARNYAFMTGISIDNTGGKLKYDFEKEINTNSSSDTTLPVGSVLNYKLQYINIPLGLKFKTNQIGYTTFFTHLGINGGINIKASGEIDNFELNNENISDEVKLFTLGYFIGAGVEYSIAGNTAIVVGITYTNGFIDITPDSNNKVTLSNFALRLGVLF
ncbi:MAG: porin family protein [Bacteroidales bacterium]|jgi:opacity protein-like surface antigen|nr:porin family protein [Bacteroidales bacterium]